ncbi:MAG: hypothetical protein COV08_00980 [Candidatus Vogelbacteria bacterium CG10_big_fil_rev_8_21_14_0_10_49_38]|uniref:RND efflux pump membrane fusion protein barrel-sandwich domain-containing protein n=1 Tax=Candidatus Vogelbacteria bacterium CG10_big_fil_rev_8_21_14_0_10_49_38 TaxID=1975043 RepID=A0A2H0RI96_9BACT|nr:MAG: hypothetical protein BK006_00990 [bacterium CG10_49_38]PIR46177.1 MAG: hypothetical protein COV08_00980 [Candidatus Vogelbacteria bacterium CG10_big_fil_rev_8_21_14_0_10_49_38]
MNLKIVVINKLNHLKNFYRRHPKKILWLGVPLLLLIGLGAWAYTRRTQPEFETEVVKLGEVADVVSDTGLVTAENDLTLSFETGGVVRTVKVTEGDAVYRGQTLVSLDASLKAAEVASARATLAAQEAKLAELVAGPTKLDLASAKTKLENARKTLLTADLQAYFAGPSADYAASSFTYTAPTVLGTYNSDQEGEYVLELYQSGAPSGYSVEYSGLETGIMEGAEGRAEPLGRRGLYLQFPENFIRAPEVIWRVPIPNTKSASYATNRRAYEQAQADYDLKVAGTRAEQIVAAEAQARQARATLQSAQASLSKLSLTAPVAGLVKSVPVTVGETVTVGSPAVALVSDHNYYVTLYVPEAEMANLTVGDLAEIRLKAFPDRVFRATVGSVAPAAEDRDGVASFKVKLYFQESDPQIRVGMSADVDLEALKKTDVMVVPGRAVVRSNGRIFVRVWSNKTVEERSVEIGLRGSDGSVEIVSGLSVGEEVITFIRDEELDRLAD